MQNVKGTIINLENPDERLSKYNSQEESKSNETKNVIPVSKQESKELPGLEYN